NRILDEIVLKLHTPVLAIAGNHDSPSRLHFGSNMMTEKDFHIVGQLKKNLEPVTLHDEDGEVHFYLIPYCDPSIVRNMLEEEEIKNHDDATRKIVEYIKRRMDPN